MSAPAWIEFVAEKELRPVVRSHAASRRKIRDGYLRWAAGLLHAGRPWTEARALAAALRRYEASQRYVRAKRLGREDGSELDQALFAALTWGPVPTSVRQIDRVLTAGPVAKSMQGRTE